MRQGATHSTGRPRGGFTLVEVLVAIGILAVLGVVIGTIFSSVGDTVTQGRQVSNMNRFAARVERVMRRDFENMVRENGFLVIRNELTHDFGAPEPTLQPVPLTADAVDARVRRIDEIMFFSRGDFTSRRTPLHRDMVARSDVARIYYGHGQKMPVDFGPDPDDLDYETRYARPRLDEPNNFSAGSVGREARLGMPSEGGVVNPNEFASDWTLLRHVTLLVPREQGFQNLPDEVFGLTPNAQDWFDYNRVADHSRQVGLGPAAQSVFRSLAHLPPYELNPEPGAGPLLAPDPSGYNIRDFNGLAVLAGGGDITDPLGTGADETRARPLFTSGIVDVAVTGLDEIRAAVTSPWIKLDQTSTTPNYAEVGPLSLLSLDYSGSTPLLEYERGRSPYSVDGRQMVGTVLATINPGELYGTWARNHRPQNQQRWMLDALPSVPFDPVDEDLSGFRVRYEDVPPRVYLDDGTIDPEDREALMYRAMEQADQEMLTSGVFLPRCTEFIVEWSLGIVDQRDPGDNPNYGQPIWHGLRRFNDRNGDGQYDEGGDNAGSVDALLADLFGLEYDGADLADDPSVEDFGIRGALPADVFEDGNEPDGGDAFGIDEEFVELLRLQRIPDAPRPENTPIAEYAFGYSYLDWNGDDDGDGFIDNDDDDVRRTWPWPKLIRVTMRFVDPSDLETERTYQVEFRVPPRGKDAS